MASTITYRQLGPNNDPVWGNGLANYISDIDAVAQAIQTRLLLLQGEWWEDLSIGFPLFQELLGVPGAGKEMNAAVNVIVQQILGTPYVNEVSNVRAGYNPGTRAFSFQCNAQTAFGVVSIAFPQPGNSASLTA